MRDVRDSSTIPLKNGFENTASRYSGAFSIMARYARIPYE